MNFAFAEELLEIRQMTREFAEKEIRSHVMEWDEHQVFPRQTIAKLGELGFMGMKDHDMKTIKESAMAKLFASEVAVRAADQCIQIHGGYGYIKDYPAEKFFRDSKLCTIGEGTSEIQRLVIARELLRTSYAAPA
jgi:alkylation response protein AidB-like acyl-CoA dehydrogenase